MAANLTLSAQQGADYQPTITWQDGSGNPINLTGYSGKMDIRTSPVNSSPLILSLTTSNSMITLGTTNGVITLDIPAATTLTLTPGTYYYDLFLTSGGGIVYKIAEGTFTLEARVTQ